MIAPFLHLLHRPHFDDASKTRVAMVLHAILWVLLPINTLSLIYLTLSGNLKAWHLPVIGAGFALIFGALILVQRGHLRIVGGVMTLNFLLDALALPFVVQISSGLVGFTLLLACLFAGTVLRLRALLAVVIASALIWLGWGLLILADGRELHFGEPVSALTVWIVESIFFLMMMICLFLVLYYLHYSGSRLDQQALMLEKTALSADYLDNIFQSMAEMLIVTNPNGIIEKVNRATLHTLGYKEADLLGQPIRMLMADRTDDSDGLTTLRRTGRMEQVERVYRTKAGKAVPVLVSGVLMRTADAQVSGIITVGQDITELRQMRSALAEQDLRYQQAAEAAAISVWQLDLRDNTIQFDEMVSRLLGYTPDEVPTSVADFLMLIPEEDRLMLIPRFEAYLTDPVGTYSVEHRVRHRDGHLLWMLSRGSVLYDDAGQPERMVCLCMDITERKRMEDLVLQAERHGMELELERRKMRLLADIFHDVSHDFRTPLTIINTSLYRLEKSDDPEDRHNRARVIERQTQRMAQLLDALFAMIRLDGDPPLEKHPLDIAMLVQDAAHTVQRRMNSAHHWVFDLPAHPLLLLADEAELRTAIENIIANAIEFTPENGTITIGIKRRAKDVEIVVRDTGIGIAPEHQPLIFQRLYRVDKARSPETGGAGLGLSIAQRIINLHDGYIQVASVPGEGSVFTIHLPL